MGESKKLPAHISNHLKTKNFQSNLDWNQTSWDQSQFINPLKGSLLQP